VTTPDGDRPNPPAALSVNSVTATQAVVEWAPTVDAAEYQVLLDGVVVDATPDSSLRLGLLLPDTQYKVAVTVIDADGRESVPSAPITFKTASLGG